MSKTYIAKIGDRQVGKRTTKNRTYEFAVVAEKDVHAHRVVAGNYATQADFRYALEVLEGRHSGYRYTEEQLEAKRAMVKDGFEAWRDRCRAAELATLDADEAAGNKHGPYVVSWCGRRDLAELEAAKLARREDRWALKNIQVVPAIEVVP